MLVKDLIKILQQPCIDPEYEICIANDEEGNEIITLEGARSKALKFLNALETSLHDKFLKDAAKNSLQSSFAQIFKVRQFLRQPGSSAKNLMESVALIVPSF